MLNHAERRRSQRVSARLPLKVCLDPDSARSLGEESVETINISLSGVHFRSNRFMAPMTKLAMALELEVEGQAGGAVERGLVQCQGLVVRVQPEEELSEHDQYEIAVFFTWIEPQDQRVLQEHINFLIRRQSGK